MAGHHQEELTGASLDMYNRKKEQEARDAEATKAKEKAQAYLAGGGTRDAEYDKILKDGGTNNHEMNQWQKGNQKAAYDQKQQARKAEAAAYQQSRRDMKEFRESSTSSPTRNVDQSTHYKHLQDTKGSYGGSKEHSNAVSGLMGTGQKFTNLDVRREMGSASTNNLSGLYKQYGGIDNYKKNYSVGSGNWQSSVPQSQIGTMKEADDSQRQYFSDQKDFYNNDFKDKYGQYDWAQKSIGNMNQQADSFTQSFDKREQRIKDRGEGHVYGY